MAIVYNPETNQYEDDQSGSNTPTNPGAIASPAPEPPPVATAPPPPAATTPPPPTPPPAAAGGDFGPAWIASGGKTAADLKAFADQWNATHPTDLVTLGGSKGDKATYRGKTYDAVLSAGMGGLGASWSELTGGSDATGGGAFGIDPSYLQPFATPFNPGADAQLPTAPEIGEFSYPDFHAPDADALLQDPGYQFRVQQALGAMQNSAAAKGVLRSGGTLYDLGKTASDFGSQEYGNVFGRNFDTWKGNRENEFGNFAMNAGLKNQKFTNDRGLADDAYNRAWSQYLNLEDTFYKNQSNPFDKLYKSQSLGLQAASV